MNNQRYCSKIGSKRVKIKCAERGVLTIPQVRHEVVPLGKDSF
jgi:hypothetical protein